MEKAEASSGASVAVRRLARALSAQRAELSELTPSSAARKFMSLGDPNTVADYRNYQVIVDRAVDVFGDEIKASRWLSTPSDDFAGKTPLEAAEDSGYSLAALEPIFVAIEHGIY